MPGRMRQRAVGLACGLIACTAFTAVPTSTAFAADVPERNPPTEHRAVREARDHLGAQRWEAARRLLEDHVRAEPRDADGFNLLGYSLRKLRRLDEALKAYGEALRLDPDHRGAHEYIGEAYLMLGDLQRARWHLAALERLCPLGCEELDDLRAALKAAPPTGR
jgi:cytochrome c-type biogenesis protein CcmH/NrfG